MIEDLKQVRDALLSCGHDGTYMSYDGDLVDKDLATLDRIIAEEELAEKASQDFFGEINRDFPEEMKESRKELKNIMLSAAPTPAQQFAKDETATEDSIREMIRDPKYWRDKDPETIKKVSAAFNVLYGVTTTPAQPKKVDLEKLAEEIALQICKNKGYDPEDYDEWYCPQKVLFNPLDALKILAATGRLKV